MQQDEQRHERGAVFTNRPNLFLHFMDSYRSGHARDVMQYPQRLITNELFVAFRLAYLTSPQIFVSASAFMENATTRRILQSHSMLATRGELWLIGAEGSLAEHNETKRALHYARSPETDVQRAYMRIIRPRVPYMTAPVQVAAAIEAAWLGRLEQGLENQFGQSGDWSARERAWARVPEVIGDSAFVAPHIEDALHRLGSDSPKHSSMLKLVDQGYAASHADVLRASVIGDLIYLRLAEDDALTHRVSLSYRQAISRIPARLRDEISAANPAELVELKTSLNWTAILTTDLSASTDISHRPQVDRRGGIQKRDNWTVAIVVTLPIEWAALKSVYNARSIDALHATDPNLEYAVAEIRGSHRSIDLVMLFIAEPGQVAAGTQVSNLIRSRPEIKFIIVGGIAGACPTPGDSSKDIRLGDIVVSAGRGIIQIDFAVAKDGGSNNRSTVPPPSAALLRVASFLYAEQETMNERTWAAELSLFEQHNLWAKRPSKKSDVLLAHGGEVVRRTRRDNPAVPRVFHGSFGSSNLLVRDHRLRDSWRDTFDILAVEMEGAGVGQAAWKSGLPYLMVRSMVDYCDDRSKNDQWHGYASAASALYIRKILERSAGGAV